MAKTEGSCDEEEVERQREGGTLEIEIMLHPRSENVGMGQELRAHLQS